MKAIVCTKYGSPDALQLQDMEKPTPKANEVLVMVYATSINSWDWELVQGIPFVNKMMAGLFKPSKIKVFGCDIAGVVETVGNKVTLFKKGDEVFGDLSSSGWGGFAEYVTAPETSLTAKPRSMTFEQAAALPQAGLLALQGLVHKAKLKPGKKVLINGAGGGAGTFSIQLAKSLGAEVTAIDSAEKLELMSSLGADFVFDYHQFKFTDNETRYDIILDMQSFLHVFDYTNVLTDNGQYIAVGGSTSNMIKILLLGGWYRLTNAKKMGLLLHKANQGMDAMIKLFEEDSFNPVIDKCYPLHQTPQAFEYFAAGHCKGKVVIRIIANPIKAV